MNHLTIGIVGSGPGETLPDLTIYKRTVDLWIGADRGALHILRSGLEIHDAVGDFDSVTTEEMKLIREKVSNFNKLPSEKDETDLELALNKAFQLQPATILLFGVTAGRKDHELINIQLLYRILEKGIIGKIIDRQNQLVLTKPGTHTIERDPDYPYVSFVPFSEVVEGITLNGFYYPLENETITWGSTLCISNELSHESGNFSYRRGILLLIKSRDS
ncbi:MULTISPECIES: thiamine diphosphokinase [unclassified Oceanobacillus]|uniref:thiamine diphosphokinase n=1 Tax=unclassified Oceanobacillus TaxID=2630292 RepID=UPI0012EB7914|nr:thiamine diphosphokinase [Oceanobacillus sp. AG]